MLPVRKFPLQQIIKPFSVIRVDQMAQFVNNHIFHARIRFKKKLEIEGDPSGCRRTASPTCVHGAYRPFLRFHPVFFIEMFHPGSGHVQKFDQCFFPELLQLFLVRRKTGFFFQRFLPGLYPGCFGGYHANHFAGTDPKGSPYMHRPVFPDSNSQ